MNWKQPKAYAVQHKDEAIRAASRSGGIFTAVSDYMIDRDGVVYGCVLTKDFKAAHVRADSKDDRDKMRGSKYIQSKIGDTYINVKADLMSGKNVLFSGTSCQIAGLKSFLGKEYENLLCIDIICHGVPSPKVWEAYLKWQEQRNKGKTVSADFRDKNKFGWRDHIETVWFDNGKVISSPVFKNLFFGHTVVRPSCYECPYKSMMHPADITIGDYWGIENAAPEFYDNKGVSLVLINNDFAEKIFDGVKKDLRWIATRIEDSMQPSLKSPYPEPKNRNQFWEDFQKKNFSYVAKKYGGYGFISGVKTVLRNIKKKLKGSVRR